MFYRCVKEYGITSHGSSAPVATIFIFLNLVGRLGFLRGEKLVPRKRGP
jgi:hypothetical protein